MIAQAFVNFMDSKFAHFLVRIYSGVVRALEVIFDTVTDLLILMLLMLHMDLFAGALIHAIITRIGIDNPDGRLLIAATLITVAFAQALLLMFAFLGCWAIVKAGGLVTPWFDTLIGFLGPIDDSGQPPTTGQEPHTP